MDLNLIKSKLASMQQKSGGSKRDLSVIIWKPAIGKHSVRMVPSAHNKQWPFKELFFHYGIGNRTMISLTNLMKKILLLNLQHKLANLMIKKIGN
jgi:hypothetical protein